MFEDEGAVNLENVYLKKDLLGIRGLTPEEICFILAEAAEMREKIDNNEKTSCLLENISVATLFYENSTRTKLSFTKAAKYLGAKVTDLGISTSSVNKGESLLDTGKNLEAFGVDVFIIRHGFTGAAEYLAKNVSATVINGGDGINEHPTQALLDFFTMQREFSSFRGLNAAILGDINHSRVARSNLFGLTELGANVKLIAPSTLVSKDFENLGSVKVSYDIADIKGADVVMCLRMQRERQSFIPLPDLEEYTDMFGITKEVIEKYAPNALIMHPGPVNRGVELSADTINMPNSVIYEQAKNGVAVRMALLKILTENLKRGAKE
ncbi:MAG: aspartate carbamoyltransferase catalytic subunit [Clostridiales bacterium]|jgi:aspartate carbamoyltransferase catalytic subunit|nr:aspartate carbamoyltransferase catalytic subunit [Clostridiales bacterium]